MKKEYPVYKTLVESIQLSKTQIIIPINNATATISATSTPNDAYNPNLTWSISNSNIATLTKQKNNNWLVTPQSIGTCVITCKSEDGNAISACNVTITDGYAISTPTDLQNINFDNTGKYYLLNDIDMSGFTFSAISYPKPGNNYVYFEGVLDGQGHTIYNYSGNAMFSRLTGAKIKNIIFKNLNLTDSNGLFGWLYDGTTFDKVGIEGNVVSYTFSRAWIGTGTITFNNCYARTNIIGGTEGSFNYDGAGFVCVGKSVNANLTNCYWSGTSRKTNRTEAMVTLDGIGNNSNTAVPPGRRTSCYYNSQLYKLATTDGAIGLTTQNFADKSRFSGWDFINTWYINENGYPELKFNQ